VGGVERAGDAHALAGDDRAELPALQQKPRTSVALRAGGVNEPRDCGVPAADQIRDHAKTRSVRSVRFGSAESVQSKTRRRKPTDHQGFREADARNRTGDPFITSASFAGQLP
jgi:hypothetical protein